MHNVFHVSLLEPYVPNAFPSRNTPQPLPVQVTDSDVPEYEVENIFDARRRCGRGQHVDYLVRWKGYDISDDC